MNRWLIDRGDGRPSAARPTIDLAAGDRALIGIGQKATADWLRTDVPVLDYANAMVPSKQPTASGAIANWQEHIDGKAQYAPPIPPARRPSSRAACTSRSGSIDVFERCFLRA